MDKLVAELEVETKTEIKEKTETKKINTTEIVVKEKPPILNKLAEKEESQTIVQTEYLNSFDKNMTVADFKRQEEKKELEKFKEEKETLIQEQYNSVEKKEETKQEVVENVIEKPNYDLIQENKKIIHLKKTQTRRQKQNKKLAGLALACALGVSAIIGVVNVVIMDNMNASYSQLHHEYYDINLPKYLKNLTKIDTTKKGLDLVETYPEELLDAGDVGKKSNWFDKICGFFSGIFGG